MTDFEVLAILQRDRELNRFNPMTGEDRAMSKENEESAIALDRAIHCMENFEAAAQLNEKISLLCADLIKENVKLKSELKRYVEMV